MEYSVSYGMGPGWKRVLMSDRSFGKSCATSDQQEDFHAFHRHKDFHGCEIRLEKSDAHGDALRHLVKGAATWPTVRSYPDGLKVGCTFLTSAALELIYRWHEDFLVTNNTRTHQG